MEPVHSSHFSHPSTNPCNSYLADLKHSKGPRTPYGEQNRIILSEAVLSPKPGAQRVISQEVNPLSPEDLEKAKQRYYDVLRERGLLRSEKSKAPKASHSKQKRIILFKTVLSPKPGAQRISSQEVNPLSPEDLETAKWLYHNMLRKRGLLCSEKSKAPKTPQSEKPIEGVSLLLNLANSSPDIPQQATTSEKRGARGYKRGKSARSQGSSSSASTSISKRQKSQLVRTSDSPGSIAPPHKRAKQGKTGKRGRPCNPIKV